MTARPPLPLAEASRRLRRPAGRPRQVRGGETPGPAGQGAALAPALGAGPAAVFATPLPRALPLRVTRSGPRRTEEADAAHAPADGVTTYPASEYSGIPLRTLMRLIATGHLRPIRVPGMGRLLLDRLDLDALLERSKAGPPNAGEALR